MKVWVSLSSSPLSREMKIPVVVAKTSTFSLLHALQTVSYTHLEELLAEDLELLDKEFIPSHFHAREGDLVDVYKRQLEDPRRLFPYPP